METGQPRRERLSRDERRTRLLDAAAHVVLDEGPDAATMEAVARAAGASGSLGYAYFANRTEMLLALLERAIDDLDRRSAQRLAGATSFEEMLHAGVAAWFDLVDERGPLLAALLQTTQLQQEVAARRDALTREAQDTYASLAMAAGVPAGRAQAAAAVLLAGLGGALQGWAATDGDRADYEDTTCSYDAGCIP